MQAKNIAILYAIFAAALYAINVPLSKILLDYVEPTMMASFLYLGAGLGLFIYGLIEKKIGRNEKKESLTKNDLPYTIAMVLLDIMTPILFMLGITMTNSANVSLLNNFEIVVIKGTFSGLGSLVVALIIGEHIPSIKWLICVLVLGFISYGLSIHFYVMAQKDLGAAKTSAYYAIAPFLGVAFSMLLLNEKPSMQFYIAFIIMIISTYLMIKDTIELQHTHSGDSENHIP